MEVNKKEYMQLIEEDLAALENSNISELEKWHIRDVLNWSVEQLYPSDKEYLHNIIQRRLSYHIQIKKREGFEFISDEDIDKLIDKIIEEEKNK